MTTLRLVLTTSMTNLCATMGERASVAEKKSNQSEGPMPQVSDLDLCAVFKV